MLALHVVDPTLRPGIRTGSDGLNTELGVLNNAGNNPKTQKINTSGIKRNWDYSSPVTSSDFLGIIRDEIFLNSLLSLYHS